MKDTVYDWKFVGLSHNTVRGAAGGAVLCAETLKSKRIYPGEIIYRKIIKRGAGNGASFMRTRRIMKEKVLTTVVTFLKLPLRQLPWKGNVRKNKFTGRLIPCAKRNISFLRPLRGNVGEQNEEETASYMKEQDLEYEKDL